jgi:TonB family protein
MRRSWRVRGVAGILVVAGVVFGQTGGKYTGAGIARGGDVAFPVNTAITGMVTLEVSVGPGGGVEKVHTVVDTPPLTEAATSAVKNWKYSPATLNGAPVAGVVDVNVVFNPFNPGGAGIANGSAMPEDGLEWSKGDFHPAQVKSATFAVFPANTVTSGTVVILAKVGGDGNLVGARVLKGAGVLSAAATRALGGWRFAPATYKGAAVESYLPVAFVFPSAALGNP